MPSTTVEYVISESALEEQIAYYRAIAAEYDDHTIDVAGRSELLQAVATFRPTGHVLELACGRGQWTEGLLRSAASVTAVDAAPEMLAVARARTEGSPVSFVEANLFEWEPERRYDSVFFGFWLSHVPEERFDGFWSFVDRCLSPGGDVFFVDDNHRTEAELIEGPESPFVERRLNDGTAFRAIKIAHVPATLEHRLRELGWDITVTASPGPFYWGSGVRSQG